MENISPVIFKSVTHKPFAKKCKFLHKCVSVVLFHVPTEYSLYIIIHKKGDPSRSICSPESNNSVLLLGSGVPFRRQS